jgi:hypothetical protein
MENTSNAPALGNPQLSLFDTGETLAEINVPKQSSDENVRDIGRALVTLTRYHDAKAVQS